MVEQTPGLSVFRGGDTFDSVGGCANVKNFLTKILNSKNNPVRCIGFIDEIEKMVAGGSSDFSGDNGVSVLNLSWKPFKSSGILFKFLAL
jgi:hypothetical protein